MKQSQSEPSAKPEAVLKSAIKTAGSLPFSIHLLKHVISRHVLANHVQKMPSLFDMFVLEAVTLKTMVTVDSAYNLSEGGAAAAAPVASNAEAKAAAVDLLPQVLGLIARNLSCVRWNLIEQMIAEDAQQGIVTVSEFLIYLLAYTCITY